MQVSSYFRRLALSLPRSRASWVPLTAAVLFSCSAPYIVAQAQSGVTGTITDNSGAIIPGAEVTITENNTQTSQKVVTTSSGTYAATGLLPGRYTITVLAAGFSKTIKDQVNIEVSTQATIDIVLTAGGSDTTVEVTSPLIALNTTQPELGTTIEPAVVAALPVAIGGGRTRQIDQLQFLAPGTQGDTFSHRINGGVNFESEILYNGIPAPQSETAGYTTNFNPPFELVNEFRVERSTFSAKYGLAQGAVTYQTASGTNALHGDAFYINRNEYFDARGFFNTTTPDRPRKQLRLHRRRPRCYPAPLQRQGQDLLPLRLGLRQEQLQQHQPRHRAYRPGEKPADFSDFVDSKRQRHPHL